VYSISKKPAVSIFYLEDGDNIVLQNIGNHIPNYSGSYEPVPIQELTTSLCKQLTLVHPKDGGDTILRNVGSYKSHMVSSPRR
jgi:hypothetical protein